jgi:multicomponent Na+:H+ antiporter subunit G
MMIDISQIRDVLTGALIIAGSAFVLIGAIGLIRLPDFYSRTHASGMIDTLGAGLILVGLMLQTGFSLITLKLFLIGLFIFFTSPTATHAVAHAAYVAGHRPWTKDGGPPPPVADE